MAQGTNGDVLAVRPARVQVSETELTGNSHPQPVGTVYNVWYGRWSGGDKDPSLARRLNPYRCNIERDSGYTRADAEPDSYCCLYFARGICFKGAACDFLHRLPSEADVHTPSVDCFGRDKFANYRDDMGGVGSFLRENKVLFVGGIKLKRDIEKSLKKNFKEWGSIERIKLLPSQGSAFIAYEQEHNAQFAKEAMANQSIGGGKDEVLSVKWATEDRNPHAIKRSQEAQEKAAQEAILKVLHQSTPLKRDPLNVATITDAQVEDSGLISEQAKKRLKAAQSMRNGPLVDYPDSDPGSESDVDS